MNTFPRHLWSILAVIALAGCSSAPQQAESTDPIVRDTYCDSYLVYDMCVQDVDEDGIADLMYFKDTQEVFMVTSQQLQSPTRDFSLHRCVQEMDAATQAASTRLLTIDEHTGMMRKTQLKSKLMLVYMHYYNDIQSCMNGHTVAGRSESGDSFGDDEHWSEDEFGEL